MANIERLFGRSDINKEDHKVMRIGYNPHKDKVHEDNFYIHHVIIPVYLPTLGGYYKDGLAILKYCLRSLFTTVHSKTFITVTNNGSAFEVREYLEELFKNGEIHELINTGNCGKLNAVIKGISGHDFPLVTVADADVLFLNGWQNATYEVFHHFPKAGAVCPTPSSRAYKTYTGNILLKLFFSKSLFFSKVQDPDALVAFAESIDNQDFYNEYHLSQYLTVSNRKFKAVVGAGHYVATYRGEVFNTLPKYSNFKLGGDSEVNILDMPVMKCGFWRLSTLRNYAKHMGNVVEPWMADEFPQENNHEKNAPVEWQWKRHKTGRLHYIMVRIFSKIITQPFLLKQFLKYKGLSAEAAKKY